MYDIYRLFNDFWDDLYFFVDHKSKPLCLICEKTVSVLIEFSIKLHYNTEYK